MNEDEDEDEDEDVETELPILYDVKAQYINKSLSNHL